MTPEMMNCLIGCLSLLAGYFARHFNVALPGISIPAPQPAVAPVAVPTAGSSPPRAAAVSDPIIQQLLAHQMELIRQLGAFNTTFEPAPSAAPSAPSAR